MRQEKIRRELGLHRSTVSEALGKLEELGWIERERDYGSPRHNLVGLTPLGYRRFRAAATLLFVRKMLARPVDRLVRLLEPRRSFGDAFNTVWENLNAIARYFGDSSTCEMYSRQNSYVVGRDHDPAGLLRGAIIDAHWTRNWRERRPGEGPCEGLTLDARRCALLFWRASA